MNSDDDIDYTAEPDAVIAWDVGGLRGEVRVPMTMHEWSQLDEERQWSLLESDVLRRLRGAITYDQEDDRP